MNNVVIDLSHHMGRVNLTQAKADGITTVIHKCTQGTTFVDRMYDQNKAAAAELGLTWAAYHFADGSDGAAQAEHFLNRTGTVKRYIVDLQLNPKGTTVGKKQAEDLVEAIEEKTGVLPIVYGSPIFLDSLNSQLLAKCDLWLASYRSTPRMPKLWKSWLMWQYTNGQVGPEPHTVKGVGRVDRSYLQADSL
uniref:Lysozyme M1 n=2 Tax=Lygus hesperus TaxID=30085 RepID=A0A0K8SVM9_LYGHE